MNFKDLIDWVVDNTFNEDFWLDKESMCKQED